MKRLLQRLLGRGRQGPDVMYIEVREGPIPAEASGRPAAFEIRRGQTLHLGRGNERVSARAVTFDHPYVAKLHAALRFGAEGLEVLDTASHCGTHLNGRQVRRAAVAAGDEIRLAAVLLVVHEQRPSDEGRSVQGWIDLLAELGPTNRTREALTRHRAEVLAAFLERLDHPDPQARGRAMHVLAQLGADAAAAVPRLTAALEEPEPHPRLMAAHCLGAIGPPSAPAVPALAEPLTRDPGEASDPRLLAANLSLRDEVTRALGRIGPGAVAAVPALRRARETDGFTVRALATSALERILG